MAENAGVSGWARNLADGTVEVVIEGEPEAVATVESWCSIGPPGSLVTSVAADDEPPNGLDGFSIR